MAAFEGGDVNAVLRLARKLANGDSNGELGILTTALAVACYDLEVPPASAQRILQTAFQMLPGLDKADLARLTAAESMDS